MDYSADKFESKEVDDSIINSCEIAICPIMLLELILAEVRGNTIYFSAHKRRKQLSIVSELSDEIDTLERTVNNSDVPERIQELKDSLEREVEKEDLIEPIRPVLR